MIRYMMRIELKSDLCCGAGTGNGSNIDTLTAFDSCGLPLIPGKRLKGLLRECGEFLEGKKEGESERFKHGVAEMLFGGLGGKQGLLRVDNATVENYEDVRAAFLSPQIYDKEYTAKEVSAAFTAYRAQTRIDESGIADKGSLRTTQVVKKDNFFFAELTLYDDSYATLLESCIKTLRHIGLNKTRGFGEVVCTFEKNIVTTKVQSIGYVASGKEVTYPYTITLLDDMVISGGSNTGVDYISGTMLQGAFAKLFAEDAHILSDAVMAETVFGNAYISDGKNTFQPTPLSLIKIKNSTDKLVFNPTEGYVRIDGEQYEPVGGYCRMDRGVLYLLSVGTAFEYHNSTKTNDLFVYRKILAGQTFTGTITADENAVQLFREAVKEQQGFFHFGGSVSAQYGKCKFKLDENTIKTEPVVSGKKYVLELLSDTIVLDKNGNNSGNPDVLLESIGKFAKPGKVYSKNVTVGGFSAYWKLPKPQYIAFSKGTVVELNDVVPDKIPQVQTIGAYTNVGYGRFILREVKNATYNQQEVLFSTDALAEEKCAAVVTKTVQQIESNRELERIRKVALEVANTANISELSHSCAMRLYALYQPLMRKENVSSLLAKEIENNFKGKNDKRLMEFSNDAVNRFSGSSDVLFCAYMNTFIAQTKRRYQREAKI